jgi:biopolymer transport protein ExbB
MNPLVEFMDQANFVWEKGGSLMPALGVLAIYLYYLTFDLWLRLRAIIPSDLRSFPRERWGAFKGGGRVDRIIRYCLADHSDREETLRRFERVRNGESSYLNRRLRFLFVLATSAPLIGLLGTVAGMLRTFDGLSMQDTYKMDLVAGGISQALVTTQAGLLIAIPAIAMTHLLNRKKKDWLQCINRLESLSLRQLPEPIAR